MALRAEAFRRPSAPPRARPWLRSTSVAAERGSIVRPVAAGVRGWSPSPRSYRCDSPDRLRRRAAGRTGRARAVEGSSDSRLAARRIAPPRSSILSVGGRWTAGSAAPRRCSRVGRLEGPGNRTPTPRSRVRARGLRVSEKIVVLSILSLVSGPLRLVPRCRDGDRRAARRSRGHADRDRAGDAGRGRDLARPARPRLVGELRSRGAARHRERATSNLELLRAVTPATRELGGAHHTRGRSARGRAGCATTSRTVVAFRGADGCLWHGEISSRNRGRSDLMPRSSTAATRRASTGRPCPATVGSGLAFGGGAARTRTGGQRVRARQDILVAARPRRSPRRSPRRPTAPS